MTEKLTALMNHELELLKRLSMLAEKQQIALIKHEMSSVEKITKAQEQLSEQLKKAEDIRINFLASWLKIPRKDAGKLPLSLLEKNFPKEESLKLLELKASVKDTMTELKNLNTTNKILANRANNSVNKMISLFTNGKNHVCNVKI